MATAYSGAKQDPSASNLYYRIRMVYSITSNPATSATVGVTYTTLQLSTDGGSTFSDWSAQTSSQTITIGGTATTSKTISKTHSSQSVAIKGSWTFMSLSFSISTSITVDAKTHYVVSYSANGGTGAPDSQTKWHDETLTLRTGTPTRTGYKFKGWSKTSTGAVAYAAGGSFGLNATTTLYAVWEKLTYSVTYYPRDGSPTPSSQTKTYGVDLTLSNTVPSLTNYTFKGWATSVENARAGTVSYAKGATYKGNAALNLYAVWERIYSKPTIKNVKVERCLQSGTLDDEGTYAKVTFTWSVFRTSVARYYGGNTYPYSSNSVSSCTVKVGTVNANPQPTLSGASGTASVIVGGSFSTSSTYTATISITDSQTIYSAHTTTSGGTLPTQYFPMDFNADASAVGFFMPAPDTGNGVYSGKDIHFFVDANAASGDDGIINQALTSLGWTDVLE